MINLNVHSSYEFLNSNIQIDPLLYILKEDKQTSVAITDFNYMHGAYEFIEKAQKENIKPIVGLEVEIESNFENANVVLYAKNLDGFHFLSKLSSRISYKQMDTTPLSFLKDITGCIAVLKNEDGIGILNEINIPREDKCVSHKLNHDTYKRAYISESYYYKQSDAPVKTILNAILKNEKINLDYLNESKGTSHIKLREDVKEFEDLLEVNKEIVSKCEVYTPKVEYTLPKFTDDSSEELLKEELKTALNKKIKNITTDYTNRLNKEYTTIVEMGYADYFLIVSDLVRYSKNNDIYVGPGRGSSGASLVAYLLDITDIDPIEYNLLFERFLNKERVTMPDIDIDFASVDRPKVLRYLQDKYGDMHVANILTYNNMTAKSAAREIGRIFNFTDSELREISNIIDENNMNLEDAFNSQRFNHLIEIHSKYKSLKKYALKIENLPRNTSIHASGVLLGRNPLNEEIPIMFTSDGISSQWPMADCEKVGLLKIDVLSLQTLSLIRYMSTRIQHKDSKFDVNNIPLNDKKTFKLLSSGLTAGIFQLESEGITRVIERYKPNSLLDLALVLAMYRPGPMEQIDHIIHIKHSNEPIRYPHDDLKDILKDTYGVMIFQEQIMQTTRKIAGFTLQEADITRRAMSKKNREELMNEKAKFIQGALKNKYDQNVSETLFDLILKFADYGFPKSHALVYSIITYRMAYIKTHYPKEFYSVMLLEHKTKPDKLEHTLQELKLLNIKLIKPSVHKSLYQNTSESNGIRLGFSMLKSISQELADKIIEARKERSFEDIYDFVSRLNEFGIRLTEKQVQALILSGSFDDFNQSRKSLLQESKKALDAVKDGVNQINLIDMVLGLTPVRSEVDVEELSQAEKINGEKEVLGFFISEHPIILKHQDVQYVPFHLLSNKNKREKGIFLVYILEVRQIRTKKNEDMAYVKITDGHTEMDAVLFPKNYIINLSKLQQDMLVIDGMMDEYKNNKQLIINRLYIVDDFIRDYIKHTKYIVVRNHETKDLTHILTHNGIPVIDMKKNSLGFVNYSQLEYLFDALGKENVRLIH